MEYQDNPTIYDESQINIISFFQTRETLMDPDIYSRFIYSIENQFRRSRFYSQYKSYIYNQGLQYDQFMRGIDVSMADIELHHALPTLKDATITISEYFMNTVGRACTFDIIKELEQCHRENMFGIIMITSTNHQVLTEDPTIFTSINQMYGHPLNFLNKYGMHFTLDIAYKWLYQFKQEEQNNFSSQLANIAHARDQLLDWSNKGYIH